MQENNLKQNTMAGIENTASILETNKVLRNTYMLLGMTLLATAASSGLAIALNLPPLAAVVCMIGSFIMMFVVNKTADSAKGIGMIFIFSILMGMSLGPMLQMYLKMANGPSIVFQAASGTALIFFVLSGYALTTKKDFSYMGGFLMVGLIVALVAGLANIFLHIPLLQLVISSVVILIMSGFILFDTSRIIHGGETNYIRATIALYLSIYNIFVHLLSILGIMNDD
jgi:modulator of FtsH protease